MYVCMYVLYMSDANKLYIHFRYRSSLITGDGLLSMGKSEEDVKAEMSKIHQENMDTLLGLKEEVLLQEKREIEQRLSK